jgi:hypothetical protein
MTTLGTSAARLRQALAASGDAMRMYLGEALYHAQVDFTCQLLDVVDEVADPGTAQRIADAIGERLAEAGAAGAADRIREAGAETERVRALGAGSRLDVLRFWRDNNGLLSEDARQELEELERDGR